MSALRDVIDATGGLVSYLRAEIGVPGDGEWLACRDLIDDHNLLSATIETTGRGRGTDDPAVAASLFAQAYAFRVASVAVAGWILTGTVPDPAAANLAVGLARHRPSSVAFLGDTVYCQRPEGDDEETLAILWDRLATRHLVPFFDAVRAVTPVGERLLWGNALGSVTRVLRAVEGASSPDRRPLVRADGERLVEAAPAVCRNLGRFVTIAEAGRDGWFWERTNCCLWYRASGGGTCDDCSLTPVAKRHAAWASSLQS